MVQSSRRECVPYSAPFPTISTEFVPCSMPAARGDDVAGATEERTVGCADVTPAPGDGPFYYEKRIPVTQWGQAPR
jgi:hypothetical protein